MGPPRADAGLVGSGLIVINPPFKLDADLKVLLPALARGVRRGRRLPDRLAGRLQ